MHNLFSLNHSSVKTSTINNGWMRVLNKTINDNITFDEKTFTYNYKITPMNKIFPNDCIRKNKSKIK